MLHGSWKEPVKIVRPVLDAALKVQDLMEITPKIVQGQRLNHFPKIKLLDPARKENMKQAKHFDTTKHIIEQMSDICKNDVPYERLVKRVWWEVDDKAWEPLGN